MFMVIGLVVVALGGLSWFFFFSGAGGGASDPEAAVRQFVEAVNGDDPLLIVQSVAPSEVDGVSDLLNRLQARLDEQGLASWDSADGTSFDVVVDLASTSVVDRADDAALVEVDGTITVDGISWPGPLGAVLDDSYELDLRDVADVLDERGVDELTVATVRESGGWYVSPMLTAANIGAGLADLPGPDLDRIGDEIERVADDGAEAIETAVDAAIRLDFEELATVIAPSVGRLVTVFEDALDELRDRALEEGYDVSDVAVDVRELDDGRYRVEDVRVEASTSYDVVQIRVRDDCIEIDGDDEGCVFDSFPGDLEHEQIVLTTAEVGGGYVVDPVASVTSWTADLIESVDYRFLLDAVGLEEFDAPRAATIGVPVGIGFDGRPFVVLEYPTQPGDRIAVSLLDGEASRLDLFEPADGFGWDEMWRRIETVESDVVRAVVWAPVDECGLVFCDRAVDESVTVVLHSALRQDVGRPDVAVSGDLAPGDGYAFSFEVTTRGRHDFSVETGQVQVSIVQDGRDLTGEILEPGRYDLEVWNFGSDDTSFRVVPR